MDVRLKTELSKKNQYWVEKHRFLELKHFCLQYPIWEKAYKALSGLSKRPLDLMIFSSEVSDPTARCAETMLKYSKWLGMVENAAEKTDPVIGDYILQGVTEGVSYEVMRTRKDIPCCREKYYMLYRKFFWLSNKERN